MTVRSEQLACKDCKRRNGRSATRKTECLFAVDTANRSFVLFCLCDARQKLVCEMSCKKVANARRLMYFSVHDGGRTQDCRSKSLITQVFQNRKHHACTTDIQNLPATHRLHRRSRRPCRRSPSCLLFVALV